MNKISDFLEKIVHGNNLSVQEMQEAMHIILSGGATPVQISAFLIAMKMKGEKYEEIFGASQSLLRHARQIDFGNHLLIDNCGTGGDSMNSYNISTTVAFILATAGCKVVKHGNKAVTSKSGSSDILSRLGINLDMNNNQLVECLNKYNIAFLFAPYFHKSLKNIMPIRQEIKLRTIFNILGPLCNPARPQCQLLGVYSKDLIGPMINVLKMMGLKSAWVVHGHDGMDEITLTTKTYVGELINNQIKYFEFNPQDLGLSICDKDKLIGGDVDDNIIAMKDVLKGKKNEYRDIVILNASVALKIYGITDNLLTAKKIVEDILDNGKALLTLNNVVSYTNNININ